jgi:hypothetical protein
LTIITSGRNSLRYSARMNARSMKIRPRIAPTNMLLNGVSAHPETSE